MQGHIHHTTAIKPARGSWHGRAGMVLVLTLAIIGVGLLQLTDRSPATVARYTSVSVAPANPARLTTLVREQVELRERLGMQVAPVDPVQLAVLIGEHMALRTRLVQIGRSPLRLSC